LLQPSFLTRPKRNSEYSQPTKVCRECEDTPLPLDSILSTRLLNRNNKSCGFANLYQVQTRVQDSLIYPVLEICDSDSYAKSTKAIFGGVIRCLRFASEEATHRGASSHCGKSIFFSFDSAFLRPLGRVEILESIVAHIRKIKPCQADISESLESQHSNINICISIPCLHTISSSLLSI
jgi:hypothetical protein